MNKIILKLLVACIILFSCQGVPDIQLLPLKLVNVSGDSLIVTAIDSDVHLETDQNGVSACEWYSNNYSSSLPYLHISNDQGMNAQLKVVLTKYGTTTTVSTIFLTLKCSELHFPAAIAPAGKNRTWKCIEKLLPGEVTRYKLKIYDVENSLVFHSTDVNESWNGTLNGHELPSGYFHYTLDYKLIWGISRSQVGSIFLVR